MRSLLVWRSRATAKSVWVNRHCRLVGPFFMTDMSTKNETTSGDIVRSISSSPSNPESPQHVRGSPKDSGIALTLELRGAREIFQAMAARTSAPTSPGYRVFADAKSASQGATPHSANGYKIRTDVEVFQAALEECTQQAQNLLAFAKKAGWAAEDLRSAPAELKESLRDTARDDSSPLHKEFPRTALQATQPLAKKKTTDAQAQVGMAEHTRLISLHASLRAEHSCTVARLNNLKSKFDSAERQRASPLAELDALRSPCSDLELLESQHQELSNEHTELTARYEQVTDHKQHVEQQSQELIAQRDQLHLELSEAKELQRETLAELEHTKQSYVTDVDRLQDEVLSLEDQLHTTKLDLKKSKDAYDTQAQQQSRLALEHHNKAVKQLSEHNSKYEAGLHEQLKRQEAKMDELVAETTELRQFLERSEDKYLDLQQIFSDCTSNLTRCQNRLELRCSELEQELGQSRALQGDTQSQLATLQADLKKLHVLTAGGHLSAEDLFHMFAMPVSSEDFGHSLEESSALSATATASTSAAAADTDGGPGNGGYSFSNPPQGTSDSNAALANGEMPGSKTTPEEPAAPDSAAGTAANSSSKHIQYGTGSIEAVPEPGAVKAGKELHDDKGVDIFDEDMSRGDRAFHLQEQLAVQFRRGYLSHTSALCLGAKAYASSAPEHEFSTEEVILSMLQHDSSFLQLLATISREAGIDQFTLESAVADTYLHLAEQEEEMSRSKRGRRPAFTHSFRVVSSPSNGAVQKESLPDITMVIPSNYQKVYQIALQSLYQYWGVPCVPDIVWK